MYSVRINSSIKIENGGKCKKKKKNFELSM